MGQFIGGGGIEILFNIGSIFFFNIHWWAFIRGSIFLGNWLEKSAFFFLSSKLGNGPLLEHGHLIEIFW